MSDAPNIEAKIKEFYDRLEQRLSETKSAAELPPELKKLIHKDELIEIYKAVLYNPKLIKMLAIDLVIPIRWGKEDSKLARTINIVFDPITQDICLFLETKSKVLDEVSGKTKKDFKHTPRSSGTSKTTKPVLRIDTAHPMKYANAVFYTNEESRLQFAQDEAEIPRKTASQYSADTFLNVPAVGVKINKTGVRPANKKPYNHKLSFYSKWADGGDLRHFLTSPPGRALTQSQMDDMAKQLLSAILALHKKGLIHQDIKPENILVFLDNKGGYRLELADFGMVFNPSLPKVNYIATATLGFESPEISAIHYYFPKKIGFDPDYFHSQAVYSYGAKLFFDEKQAYKDTIEADKEEFCRPSKANDMWAVGTVLHELYHQGTGPTRGTANQFSPLIQGLLNINRTDRFTAEQALDYFQPVKPKKKQQLPPLPPPFIPKAAAPKTKIITNIGLPPRAPKPPGPKK